MGPDTSPTARALLTLELVQSQPGITADRIADRLGVTPRAARRYVAILREAGIPIASVSGPAGGYRPGRGLRLAPLVFRPAEALGLVMAVLDGHHDAADPDGPVGSALDKLLRALPTSVAAEAEVVRRTASPVPGRAAARPDPGTTVGLVQACAEHHRLRLAYRTQSGARRQLEVDPWAVVVRHGRWYLLCWSRAAEATRAYRVDRVQGVEIIDGTAIPPADLDPVAALEEHLAAGWQYAAEVLIDAPADAVAPCLPRSLGRLEPVGERTSRLTGSTGNPTWYAEQLAPVPAAYRVVGGPELREAVRALGQRLLTAADQA